MKKSPCGECAHAPTCGWSCEKWIQWFRETWREIQLVADMKKRGTEK